MGTTLYTSLTAVFKSPWGRVAWRTAWGGSGVLLPFAPLTWVLTERPYHHID